MLYTTGQKFEIIKIMLLCSQPRLHLFDQKYSNIVKFYYYLK